MLHFDDVRVPAEALVGEEGAGFRQVFHGLNPERITGAALGVGVARYALRRAAEYAATRQVWDVPIGAHQGVAHPLAQAKIETELAALMTHKAAWLHDHGLPAGEAANMAKYAAAEAALARARRGDPDPRRQRRGHRVRPAAVLGPRPIAPHRPGEPRDDPQLRRPALARPAQELLMTALTPR